MLNYLAYFCASLLLSALVTRLVRDSAVRLRVVSPPDSGRHVHQSPIPRIGGVAIYLSLMIVVGAIVSFRWWSHTIADYDLKTAIAIVMPATLVFLIGLYDDLKGARPWLKIGAQVVAGLLLFRAGWGILRVPVLFGNAELSLWISIPLTVLWVVLITNAFNLIDGIDGLAAGSALFSTVTICIMAIFAGRSMVTIFGVALAGCILGFLRFNFNPATIFLGDSGSLLLGFMMSALALAGRAKSTTIIAIAIPVVSFGLPIVEVVLSVFRRVVSGQPVFVADRSHIHHRLLDLGLSQRQVLALLYGVSAVLALLSLLLLNIQGAPVGAVLFIIGTGVLLGVHQLGYAEVTELRRIAEHTVRQGSRLRTNVALRRAVNALSTAQTEEDLELALKQVANVAGFAGVRLEVRTESTPDGIDAGNLNWLWRPSEEAPCWQIELPLTNIQARQGSLTLYRRVDGDIRDLDLSLVINEVPPALGRSVSAIRSRRELTHDCPSASVQSASL